MRIVHVYKDSFPPVFGGIEQHVSLLAERQAQRGHAVEVLTAGVRNGSIQRSEHGGVRFTRLPEVCRFASSPVTLAFVRTLRHTPADVVHFHHPNPIGEIAEQLMPASAARIVSYHADITRQRVLGPAYRPSLVRFLRRADAVIVHSPPLMQSSQVLREIGDHVSVVPYGIAPPGSASEDRVRGRMLFVGRLREYKGLPVLLSALAQLPEAHLRIIGRGPMMGTVKERTAELGLTKRVQFPGHVSPEALDREYRQATALILPSIRRSEAFGLVLAEAMARGTPAISTELQTGTSWVNQHGHSGFVVPHSDADALAAACRELLESEAVWRRCSRGARERSQLFDAEAMTTEVLSVYAAAVRARGDAL
ncbi:MAG: glycosyltransferase [Gammaproteobacteria bacterium]